MRARKIIGLIAVALTFGSVSSYGQAWLSDPKYGPDEETRKECASNSSMYGEYYKQKNYNDAYPSWKIVFNICPKLSKNTYIRGAKIVKYKIENTQNGDLKKNYLDTLMLLYDRRIEYYNEKASVLGAKAQDLFKYAPERYEEAFGYAQQGIDLLKEKTEPSDFFTYMTLVNAMHENKKIEDDKVIEQYSTISDYMDLQIAANPNDEKLNKAKESIDGMFAQMGVANCDNIKSLFTPRFEANPTDLVLCKKIRALMLANKCTSDPLFLNVSIAVFKVEPTASLAYDIAHLYREIKGYKEMENYYNEAINHETDSLRKANYYYELASLTFSEFRKFSQARSLAYKAIDFNPSFGEAYRLIGDMYASERSCGADEFEYKAVYWAAVDKYIKAKEVDPSLTESMNALIGSYSQYYPSKEDLFFHDLKAGDGFTVGCWINERTTVRERK